MTHHHEAKTLQYQNIYYLVGLISGLFIGLVIEGCWLWIPILGIVGLLFTSFFLTVFVRDSADA